MPRMRSQRARAQVVRHALLSSRELLNSLELPCGTLRDGSFRSNRQSLLCQVREAVAVNTHPTPACVDMCGVTGTFLCEVVASHKSASQTNRTSRIRQAPTESSSTSKRELLLKRSFFLDGDGARCLASRAPFSQTFWGCWLCARIPGAVLRRSRSRGSQCAAHAVFH